jgi:hypothetical protein
VGSSGSSDKRGDVDDPQNFGQTAGGPNNLDTLGRALDEAQKEIRDGKVDPALLKQLGMNNDELKAFVEKYSKRVGELKAMKTKSDAPDQVVSGNIGLGGSEKVQEGRGSDISAGAGGEKLTPDQLKKLNEARSGKIPPELQDVTAAYFKAISGSSTSTNTTPPPPPAKSDNNK